MLLTEKVSVAKQERPHRAAKQGARQPIPLIVRFYRRADKRLVEKAAAAAGMSCSEFLIKAGLEKAKEPKT